jgi:hypothetical protein
MRACWEQAPERRRSAWPRVKLGATACAAWQRRADRGSAWLSSRNGRLALPFLILVASRGTSPEPRDAASPGRPQYACAFSALPRVLAQTMPKP